MNYHMHDIYTTRTEPCELTEFKADLKAWCYGIAAIVVFFLWIPQ